MSDLTHKNQKEYIILDDINKERAK